MRRKNENFLVPKTIAHGGNRTEERVSSATGARRWRRVRAANVASLTRQFQPRVSEFTGWFVAVKMQLSDRCSPVTALARRVRSSLLAYVVSGRGFWEATGQLENV